MTDAEPLLAKALRLLSSADDAHSRAVAGVLLGRALASNGKSRAAVDSISEAVRVLEQRRGQLARGQRRTAMIVASEEVYDHALSALQVADSPEAPDAGTVAAVLIESLRRSALSTMLHRPWTSLSDDRIAPPKWLDGGSDQTGLEDRPDAEGQLAELSSRFAEAYQPAPVEPDDLVSVARTNGYVLAFYVAPTSGATWCAWLSPIGDARLWKLHEYGANHPLGRLRHGGTFSSPELLRAVGRLRVSVGAAGKGAAPHRCARTARQGDRG